MIYFHICPKLLGQILLLPKLTWPRFCWVYAMAASSLIHVSYCFSQRLALVKYYITFTVYKHFIHYSPNPLNYCVLQASDMLQLKMEPIWMGPNMQIGACNLCAQPNTKLKLHVMLNLRGESTIKCRSIPF
jgi:hypothetical protein